ncbi:MAG: nucleotidyltransferase domain-containing protein [Muribaculum sp.]|nr:nucleotidyltransferase domain-containing protein [Muribaculum sp.]
MVEYSEKDLMQVDPTTDSQHRKIVEELHRIEREYDVKILLAVESGSRAWGFASPDSDYDVRFIYVHRPQWYFSVGKQSDTIEYMSGDRLLDFSGWELRKTLQLLSKTNPNLSDWLLTDKIYLSDEEFLRVIREVQAKFYNPIHAMYHFFNIAKRHDEGYLRRNGCTLKKFLYFLRGLLACEYIEEYRQHPPVDFRLLVDSTICNTALKNAIHLLLALKTRSKESDATVVNAALQDFAYRLYDEREKKLADFRPAPVEKSLSELEEILYRYASGIKCFM